MNSIIKASISFSSFMAGLGLLAFTAANAGVSSVKHPEASAGAAVMASTLAQVVPVVDVPEVLIRGNDACYDDPLDAGRAALRARYGLDAGDEIFDAPDYQEACNRVGNAVRNGFDRGPQPAPKKFHRSAPTGGNQTQARVRVQELEQGGRPGAEYVVVRDF